MKLLDEKRIVIHDYTREVYPYLITDILNNRYTSPKELVLLETLRPRLKREIRELTKDDDTVINPRMQTVVSKELARSKEIYKYVLEIEEELYSEWV